MSNSSNNARIKLSIDTTQAQQDVKLIDQQLDNLGKGSGVDLGIDSGQFKEFIDLQKKFIDSFSSYVSSTTSNTQKLISKLEEVNSNVNKALRRDASDEYEKKLKELENKKKMMETTLKGSSGGGSGGSGGGNNGGGSSAPSPSDDGGIKSSLKDLLGKLGGIAVGLSALRAVGNYVSQGAQSAATKESQSYMTYNKTRMFGSDFDSGISYSANLGKAYGYNAADTMSFQQGYMGQAGFTSQENLTSDTQNIMRLSKAYGLDLSATGSVAGSLVQTGALKSGEQQKFANMLASSIKDAEMTGRESEQLDVLNSINDTLGKTTTNVGQSNLTTAMGLYDMLASSNDALKGQRGANMVETMNSSIANGGSKMDLLLGWGTEFTGTEGRWALEEAKEKGISDPENLRRIITNFEKFTPYDIDSPEGKLALKEMLNLKASEVDELMENIDQIRSGNYADTLEDAMTEGTGENDINSLLDNYDKSKVSTQEEYQVEKENAQDSSGNLLNKVTSPLKGLYNMLPEWAQSAIGVGGSAVGSVVSNPIFQAWGLGKVGKFAKGKFSSWKNPAATEDFMSYTDDIVDAVNNGDDVSDMLKRFSKNGEVTDDITNWVDDVVDAYNKGADNLDDILNQGYKKYGKNFNVMDGTWSSVDDAARAAGSGAGSSVDDAAKAATSSMDEVASAMNGMDDALKSGASSLDDAAKAAAGSADDVLKSAGKASSFLGKAGKALGIIGTGIEVVTTGIDAYGAHKEGDNREMASEIGGGVGSIAGGAGGASAGAAAGGAIGAFFGGVGAVPGAIIGGIIGGIGGGVGGNAAGEAIGEGVFDAAVGEDYMLSTEQLNTISDLYDETKRLYEEKGNNAAQKYTKETVIPYLRSIGVSASRTDKYNLDVGKPDFMKDYEKGIFGNNRSTTHTSSSGRTHGGGGGSFAIGNDYIPYDNYPANLHKGEAVLTAREAEQYRQGKLGGNGVDATLLDKQTKSLSSITDANAEIISEYAALLDKEEDLLTKREKVYKESPESSDISIMSTAYGENTAIRQQAAIQENTSTSKTGKGLFNKLSNWFGGLVGGSFAIGNDYIPYDGFLSELHEGEAVLNKEDAKKWRERQINPESGLENVNYIPPSSSSLFNSGSSSGVNGKLTIELTGGIEGMTAENQNAIAQAVVEKIRYADTSLFNILNNGFVRTAH